MKSIAKFALLAAVAGVLSVPAATPSYAHWTRHHHVRVHHGYGAYAYAPRRHWNAGNRNERNCMLSPGSQRYEPCMNRP